MRTIYCSPFVCVCVCVSVSVTTSSASVRHVCDKLNLSAKAPLNARGFQLADFTKTLSFPSYRLVLFSFSHSQVGHLQFIEQDHLTTLYPRVVRVGNGR